MITYEEHERFLQKSMVLLEAELAGFHAAKSDFQTNPFHSPKARAAFEKGLEDGKAKLEQDKVMA